jgi:hypothetical protein
MQVAQANVGCQNRFTKSDARRLQLSVDAGLTAAAEPVALLVPGLKGSEAMAASVVLLDTGQHCGRTGWTVPALAARRLRRPSPRAAASDRWRLPQGIAAARSPSAGARVIPNVIEQLSEKTIDAQLVVLQRLRKRCGCATAKATRSALSAQPIDCF